MSGAAVSPAFEGTDKALQHAIGFSLGCSQLAEVLADRYPLAFDLDENSHAGLQELADSGDLLVVMGDTGFESSGHEFSLP